MSKHMRTGPMPDAPETFDVFIFECRWCPERGLVAAPRREGNAREWPFQCPGCARKYIHWWPREGAPGTPELVPMVELYERAGRDKRVPRDAFPGYEPTGRSGLILPGD